MTPDRSEQQSQCSIRPHISSRHERLNIPISHLSQSPALQTDQDPSEQGNARTDPTRRHRDAGRQRAPPDGVNSPAALETAKIGKLLLETICPKWRGGKRNAVNLLGTRDLPCHTIPQIVSSRETKRSHTAFHPQCSTADGPRSIGGKRTNRSNPTPPRRRPSTHTSGWSELSSHTRNREKWKATVGYMLPKVARRKPKCLPFAWNSSRTVPYDPTHRVVARD